MCPHPAYSALRLALLGGKVLDSFHKSRRCRGSIRQVRRPIGRPGRENHIVTYLADEHFPGPELKLPGQPYCLVAVIHEDLGFAMHGSGSLWHIHFVYASKDRVQETQLAAGRGWPCRDSALIPRPDSSIQPAVVANI